MRRNGWAVAGAAAAALAVGAAGVTQLDDGASAPAPSVVAAAPTAVYGPVTTWKEHKDTMKIFTGNANRDLAGEIAAILGRKLGNMKVGRFADGEVNVQVYETVRGKDIYIIQPTCKPVNEHLMELFLMVRPPHTHTPTHAHGGMRPATASRNGRVSGGCGACAA